MNDVCSVAIMTEYERPVFSDDNVCEQRVFSNDSECELRVQ